MKIYKEVVEKPRLVIKYDEDAESPRNWDCNLGYFYTKDDAMQNPDGSDTEIYQIVVETGDEADSQADHIKRMKKRINAETDEKVLAIYPIVKHEHGNIYYHLGTAHGFDDSNNGFYIITDKSIEVSGYKKTDKAFREGIEMELNSFNDWLNGEIYRFTLYDKDGEVEDSCGGFYGIEDIREYLPKEWKKEVLEDYLKR
jgi:hypothetical protein